MARVLNTALMTSRATPRSDGAIMSATEMYRVNPEAAPLGLRWIE